MADYAEMERYAEKQKGSMLKERLQLHRNGGEYILKAASTGFTQWPDLTRQDFGGHLASFESGAKAALDMVIANELKR